MVVSSVSVVFVDGTGSSKLRTFPSTSSRATFSSLCRLA